jgi:hypothetical protein
VLAPRLRSLVPYVLQFVQFGQLLIHRLEPDIKEGMYSIQDRVAVALDRAEASGGRACCLSSKPQSVGKAAWGLAIGRQSLLVHCVA